MNEGPPVGEVFDEGNKVFDAVVWGGVHQEVSRAVEGGMGFQCLVGEVVGAGAEDVSNPVKTGHSDFSDEVQLVH